MDSTSVVNFEFGCWFAVKSDQNTQFWIKILAFYIKSGITWAFWVSVVRKFQSKAPTQMACIKASLCKHGRQVKFRQTWRNARKEVVENIIDLPDRIGVPKNVLSRRIWSIDPNILSHHELRGQNWGYSKQNLQVFVKFLANSLSIRQQSSKLYWHELKKRYTYSGHQNLTITISWFFDYVCIDLWLKNTLGKS